MTVPEQWPTDNPEGPVGRKPYGQADKRLAFTRANTAQGPDITFFEGPCGYGHLPTLPVPEVRSVHVLSIEKLQLSRPPLPSRAPLVG